MVNGQGDDTTAHQERSNGMRTLVKPSRNQSQRIQDPSANRSGLAEENEQSSNDEAPLSQGNHAKQKQKTKQKKETNKQNTKLVLRGKKIDDECVRK